MPGVFYRHLDNGKNVPAEWHLERRIKEAHVVLPNPAKGLPDKLEHLNLGEFRYAYMKVGLRFKFPKLREGYTDTVEVVPDADSPGYPAYSFFYKMVIYAREAETMIKDVRQDIDLNNIRIDGIEQSLLSLRSTRDGLVAKETAKDRTLRRKKGSLERIREELSDVRSQISATESGWTALLQHKNTLSERMELLEAEVPEVLGDMQMCFNESKGLSSFDAILASRQTVMTPLELHDKFESESTQLIRYRIAPRPSEKLLMPKIAGIAAAGVVLVGLALVLTKPWYRFREVPQKRDNKSSTDIDKITPHVIREGQVVKMKEYTPPKAGRFLRRVVVHDKVHIEMGYVRAEKLVKTPRTMELYYRHKSTDDWQPLSWHYREGQRLASPILPEDMTSGWSELEVRMIGETKTTITPYDIKVVRSRGKMFYYADVQANRHNNDTFLKEVGGESVRPYRIENQPAENFK